MAEKVISMPRIEPVPDLIAQLEAMLEKAKSGEMRHLIYQYLSTDQTITNGHRGDFTDRRLILGGLDEMSYFFKADFRTVPKG